MEKLQDSIDFGSEDISKLFNRIFLPTLLGMLFSAIFIITDGIFVGRGVGSEALAAVNSVAPLYMVATGLGLMFGMGGSIIAAIHLSSGKLRVARIVLTQALLCATILMLLLSLLVLVMPRLTLLAFGCSEELLPLALDYLYGYVCFSFATCLIITGGYFVRLNGAPRAAMAASITAAVANIALDYIFIFKFGMGIAGAALATGIATVAGVAMLTGQLLHRRAPVGLIRLKSSRKSAMLFGRNIGYIASVGFPSLISELAIAAMVVCGNFVFLRQLGADGVAAFSVACYLFPIVFMLYNSIAGAAQPLLSYNYGVGNLPRVRETVRVALRAALFAGLGLLLLISLLSRSITSLFLAPDTPAYTIAAAGLPLFAVGFVPFAINMVSVSYYQSLRRPRIAIGITLLRGFVLMAASFFTLPLLLPIAGAWLATPLAEGVMALALLLYYMLTRRRDTLLLGRWRCRESIN